ncbi:MAG: hypothetical protein DHS20C12_24480 [Pseudohongiella sp.]|nr:MAG: hypothetical protein DHS20C12_24480 [Pseudohongiella sp.]
MKRLICFFLAVLCLHSNSSMAVVDPLAADIQEQGWMANVLIKGSRSQNYSLLCKGSLIHEYWVLTSTGCLSDPLDIIDDVVGSDSAEFAVALGNLGGFFEVEQRLFSPDGNVMLLRLERPAQNEPIQILYRSAAQLKNVVVRIFNNESSASLAHSFYNPDGEFAVSCSIEGKEFFSDGRMCYVTSRLDYSIFPIMARGRVVDPPEAGSLGVPLNLGLMPDTSGARLHVDFSTDKTLPCHEDLGAPIIATQFGELVQVGLLVAAGMPTGVPLCNGSYLNYMISMESQRDFIEESIAQGAFAQICPSKSELEFEQLSGTEVRFYWDEVNQAEGYQVLFTPSLGYEPIQTFDLGADLEFTAELAVGKTYSLSLQAYNSQCTGSMSSPINLVFES